MRAPRPVYAPSLFRPRRSRLPFLRPAAAPAPQPAPDIPAALEPEPEVAALPASAPWAFLRDDTLEQARRDHPKAYAAWSREDEARLRGLHARGWSVEALAVAVGRTPGAVRSRLRRLEAATPRPPA